MLDTTRLRELAEAATPGPWQQRVETETGDFGTTVAYVSGVSDATNRAIFLLDDDRELGFENIAFIAAANPQVILSLLNEIGRLRAAIAKVPEWDDCGEWDFQLCMFCRKRRGDDHAPDCVRKL